MSPETKLPLPYERSPRWSRSPSGPTDSAEAAAWDTLTPELPGAQIWITTNTLSSIYQKSCRGCPNLGHSMAEGTLIPQADGDGVRMWTYNT